MPGSALTVEHLGRATDDVSDLVDPASWFDALNDGARALDAWHADGQVDPRPPGHLRVHLVERVRGWRLGRGAIHAVFLDPDGRPRRRRQRNQF